MSDNRQSTVSIAITPLIAAILSISLTALLYIINGTVQEIKSNLRSQEERIINLTTEQLRCKLLLEKYKEDVSNIQTKIEKFETNFEKLFSNRLLKKLDERNEQQ
jgi:uncharacterized protein YoxC